MSKWVEPSKDEAREIAEAQAVADKAKAIRDQEAARAVRLALHATVTSTSQTNFFTGLTENISEGGVFVSTLSPPPAGERVELNVAVNESETVLVTGIVRWHRTDEDGNATGCGVQFEELSVEAAAVLNTLVTALSRDPLLHM